MAATTTQLITVEEFSKLPIDDGPVYHELRHGEIVPLTRPKSKHLNIQSQVRKLLESVAPPNSSVDREVPFQISNLNVRVADVAFTSAERHAAIDPDGWLQGAPDLVIEVLSPSNTVIEMYEREKLCFENGAKEFWVIDPDRRQVKISTPDGRTITYPSGQNIPLPLLGNATIPVDAIFV